MVPAKKTTILMQCSNNFTLQEDEDTQTMLEAIANLNFTAKVSMACPLEVHPSNQCFVMMTQKEREHDAMADGCANSHIGDLND